MNLGVRRKSNPLLQRLGNGGLFLGALVVGLFLSVLGALLSGTIIWFLWPYAIPAVFPGLVKSGVLAGRISWLAAVCFTWLIAMLVQSTKTSATVNKS